eukprot:CAMPEP_0197315514 /NCGR_PEP_ID=MMETSP0891-20130614/38568_1 /TAXON_ID=44058 ORGANISM="Aureoumbra lagunensis, Strain CCMP1510" /NCGR_SAMPLE_ID=MMETSP0891 /ASSEMBLY_ACC=CAM_ASM_000534 /LENGTH=415 /DNA_ID=CAMNT_0042804499 /DNA_START=132 /DNA_END=1379 /DNA_ORIENTATION=+
MLESSRAEICRRQLMFAKSSLFLLGAPAANSSRQFSSWYPSDSRRVELPLSPCGSEFCVDGISIDGIPVRGAILDTGSPFLNASPKSFYFRARASCLPDTDEVFAGSSGVVRWRLGDVEIGTTNSSILRLVSGIYGLPDDDLRAAPHGGLFFGLVKHRSRKIRPTLLEQLGLQVQGFQINLQNEQNAKLILSRDKVVPPSESRAVSLIDLRRYGAPLSYYACRGLRLFVNNQAIPLSKPLLVLFDTGLTGVQLSSDLLDDLYALRGIRQLAADILTENGQTVRLSASTRKNPRFLVTALDLPPEWGNAQSTFHILVLGLAFLVGNTLSIDVDTGRLHISARAAAQDESINNFMSISTPAAPSSILMAPSPSEPMSFFLALRRGEGLGMPLLRRPIRNRPNQWWYSIDRGRESSSS